MRLNQTSIEKLAWWIVLLVFLVSIATFAKLTYDDNIKFKVLNHNQNTLICIVKGFNNPVNYQQHVDFIDNCVRTNQ